MLPSKKIFALLGILIIGIVALVVYSYNKNSNITYVSSTNNNISALNSTSNGTSNSSLINNGNNTVSNNGSATPTTDTETLTSTDIFARDFFTQIVNADASGDKITADNADQFVSDYLKTALLPTINPKQYTEKDLKIIESNNANLRNYQTAITDVFTKNWPSGDKQNELLIIRETFSNDDPTALNSLSGVISIYNNALNGSLAVAVPQQAVSEHLDVVNALSAYIQTLKMIQLAYTDSISGMVGLKNFLINQQNLTYSMASLRLYLINSIK